jgi:hypothetical protein
MTPVIDFDRDELVVRDLLEPFARVQPVTLGRHPNGQRARRFRPVLAVAAGAALMLVAAGVAAATGVLPGWETVQAIRQSPFMIATDPAAAPGSIVRLSVPGPESATLKVVTNDTETVGTLHEHCTALVATDAEGRSIGGLRGCGVARQVAAETGSGAAPYEWQSPSGVTYAVFWGQAAVPSAAKVALVADNGATIATGPVEGGYFLIYAPAQLSTGSLAFDDERGMVVGRIESRHP